MTEQERVADLCERLEHIQRFGDIAGGPFDTLRNPDGPRASAELKRLAARCDALEEELADVRAQIDLMESDASATELRAVLGYVEAATCDI